MDIEYVYIFTAKICHHLLVNSIIQLGDGMNVGYDYFSQLGVSQRT